MFINKMDKLNDSIIPYWRNLKVCVYMLLVAVQNLGGNSALKLQFMSTTGHHSDKLIGVHHMKIYLAKNQMFITLKPLDVLHGFIHLKNHLKINWSQDLNK